MTIRYTKYKDGIKHNYWLCNISNIKIVYENENGHKIPVGIDATITSGFVYDEYIKDSVVHTTRTAINSSQHFIVTYTDTRKHLHFYL